MQRDVMSKARWVEEDELDISIFEKVWRYGGGELATNLILKLLRDSGFNITVLTGMREAGRVGNVKYIYSPLLDAPSKVHLWKIYCYKENEWES